MTHAHVRGLSFAIACSLLAACASTPSAPAAKPAASAAQKAEVNLASASGSLVSGKLVIVPMGDGVHITGEVGGLKPGDVRGFHIHEKGDCSAADASSAKGHFNPTNHPHGHHGKVERHAGDLPNMVADANGNAIYRAEVRGMQVTSGAAGIIGRSVVIHADPDDYQSQPAGNSGRRVGCGIIAGRG